MKKVINGKVYDTEKATLIGEYRFSNPTDFYYYEEALYKSKKGQFFIAGEGGAMTKYAEALGNGSTGSGDGMELLSPEEALDWCENHDIDSDVIAQNFELEEG
jgi:hypothetical protein